MAIVKSRRPEKYNDADLAAQDVFPRAYRLNPGIPSGAISHKLRTFITTARPEMSSYYVGSFRSLRLEQLTQGATSPAFIRKTATEKLMRAVEQ
jgi:hypothetical protein